MNHLNIPPPPPPARFELHAYGETYDVSNSLQDWKEIEVILSRKDTSGVYMEVTLPFKFVLDAYDTVEAIFEEHGFGARADLYIRLINNDPTYNDPTYGDPTYGDPYVFNLDFSTYNRSDTVIEIKARRSDLYEHLREKESVNFDMPVSEIKEDLPWNFERIKIFNEVNFLVSDDYGLLSSGRTEILSITELNSEISVGGILGYKTITRLNEINNEDSCFLTSKKNIKLVFKLNISGRILYNDTDHDIPSGFKIYLKRLSNGEEIRFSIAWRRNDLWLDFDGGAYLYDVVADKGEKFYLCMDFKTAEYVPGTAGGSQAVRHIEYNGNLNVIYIACHDSVNINIINPNRLLQKLVDKITETEGYTGKPPYPAEIEDFNTNDRDLTMLVAAESIRGFDDAKVHTSYKDFKAWMATQGYEPFVDGNRLTFRKREKSFDKNLTAIELTEEECDDLKTNVDNDYLFSALKIGYKKPEYENTDGRFEFNGQHDYATDYTGNAKSLELISPYRADGYGIEFLAQMRGRDTTDDKSDKDMFIVNVGKEGWLYKNIYHLTTQNTNVINTEILATLFNTKYNPFELLKLNAGLLGASVNKLKFTASDANRDIVIDGEGIDGDYEIPESSKLFSAINYDFASRNISNLPEGDNVNGLVKIHYGGKTYEGFIKKISKNPAWETETQWVLFKKHGVI